MGAETSPNRITVTAGTITKARVHYFERILWRACHGKVMLSIYDIEDEFINENEDKCVFLVVYSASRLENKVKKIAEGMRAIVYPISDDVEQRKEVQLQVVEKSEDARNVINQTEAHRNQLLTDCAKNVKRWYTQIMKAKGIYHVHNMFRTGNGSTLIGEAWCPTDELKAVGAALDRGTKLAGSTIPNVMEEISVDNMAPPTYNKVNKFTKGYQGLIDAYGVCNYQEVNPTPFTIITFPFLFGVMFGDMGHGIIMTIMATYLIKNEIKLKKADLGEIFNIIFGGRYIIILTGIFSIYCGFIYNDAFSKSINIFGSAWDTSVYGEEFVENMAEGDQIQMNPTDSRFFSSPYFYGTDPIWQFSGNKILWSNSFKMKASVVFGIFQMLFGLCLKFQNCSYFKNSLNIWAEFVPEMIFLNSIFTYLVVTIFAKWIFWPSSESSCAPSLLINLINIFMMTSPVKCVGGPEGQNLGSAPTYLFDGQVPLQQALLYIALASVFWLLTVKPYVLIQRNKIAQQKYNQLYGEDDKNNSDPTTEEAHIMQHDVLSDVENGADKPPRPEFSLEETIVFQIIHTIEFCLSCISHTASYLRLWALSLAHAELSEVLWTMLLKISLGIGGVGGVIAKWAVFAAFFVLTVGILILMEGLSAFLHALRLHWVEFNSKFFKGEGYKFAPFSFRAILKAPENVL